jgi:hypothetical protein
MSFPARFLTVALLAAGLTVPATLHASGLSIPRPAARNSAVTSLNDADAFTFSWFLRIMQQAWTGNRTTLSGDTGGTLDPSGSPKAAHRPVTSPSDAGGGMDPNGGPKAAHHPATPSGDSGPGLDPNGGPKSNHFRGGIMTPGQHPPAN